jgi:hypothetical protein
MYDELMQGISELNAETWINKFYETSINSTTAKDIYPLVSWAASLMAENKYETLDKIISELELQKLTPVAMICMVRTTYLTRNKLPSWEGCVSSIKDRLDSLDENSSQLLRGLI